MHTQLSTQHKLEVEANRNYIKTLIDITLYLSCQGLPFRGHDESTDSLNKGRYLFFNVGIIYKIIIIIKLRYSIININQ